MYERKIDPTEVRALCWCGKESLRVPIALVRRCETLACDPACRRRGFVKYGLPAEP